MGAGTEPGQELQRTCLQVGTAWGRRQEPRRKWQSHFPRKEERFLAWALRMLEGCSADSGLPGHSLSERQRGAAPFPTLPGRTGVSLMFFASPSPRPGEHCPATPIVISR